MFYACYNESFPIKTLKISTKKLHNPWLTPDLQAEIKRKHNLYKLYLTNAIPFETYKNFQSHVEKLLTNAKKNFCFQKLQETSGDIRKQWAFLNKLLNRNPSKKSTPSEIMHDNESFNEPPSIGISFNKHFVSVGPNIHANIRQVDKNPLEYLSNIKLNASFKLSK